MSTFKNKLFALLCLYPYIKEKRNDNNGVCFSCGDLVGCTYSRDKLAGFGYIKAG